MTKEDMLKQAKQNGHKMSKFKKKGDSEISVCSRYGCHCSVTVLKDIVLDEATKRVCKNWEWEAVESEKRLPKFKQEKGALRLYMGNIQEV